jgi:hypothetical protein
MTAEQESWTANQGILGALESQRNRALADEARAHGHIAILEARLSACQKELQASQAEFARVSTDAG